MSLTKLLTDELAARRDDEGGPKDMLERAKKLAGFPVPQAARSPELAILDAAAKALNEGGETAAVLELERHLNLPTVRLSGEWRDKPPPRPLLWRDDGKRVPDATVLSEGDVCVLAGGGGSCKSYLVISLALEASKALKAGKDCGATCGLCVAAGRAVIVSYEDSAKRIDMRAVDMGADADGVPLVPDPMPIFEFDRHGRCWSKTNYAPTLWQAIDAANPSLVFFDTGPKAMGGETRETDAVIGLLRMMETEARKGGFGVMVVVHDTKSARRAVLEGSSPGDDPGAVAGSSQWYDSPRGVLHLTKSGSGASSRILQAIKCSYGPDGWGARLDEHDLDGKFAGLTLKKRLSQGELERLREAMKSSDKNASRKQPKGRADARSDTTDDPGKGVLW